MTISKYLIAGRGPNDSSTTLSRCRYTRSSAYKYIRFLRALWPDHKFRAIKIQVIDNPEPKESVGVPVFRTASTNITNGAYRSRRYVRT